MGKIRLSPDTPACIHISAARTDSGKPLNNLSPHCLTGDCPSCTQSSQCGQIVSPCDKSRFFHKSLRSSEAQSGLCALKGDSQWIHTKATNDIVEHG